MCGITGAIWTQAEKALSQDALREMTNLLAHRGPDDSGLYHQAYLDRTPYPAQPGIALGHRRLSIIDVAGGQQPLSNEDDTVWVVFNGEIYNFQALRARLEGAGHRFKTNCDTEAIVHLYEDEGIDCFQHFNGMFAIAIWDSRRRRLILGRDRLGQKPLFYYHEQDRLFFGSELKAILHNKEVPRDIDPQAIDEYLTYQYIPHPNTIFKGIKKLSPGQSLVFEDDQIQLHTYWKPDFQHEVTKPATVYQDEVQEILTDSVRLRMQSEVPLGAFLSGGVDSSLIVALMSQLSEQKSKPFQLGFLKRNMTNTICTACCTAFRYRSS